MIENVNSNCGRRGQRINQVQDFLVQFEHAGTGMVVKSCARAVADIFAIYRPVKNN